MVTIAVKIDVEKALIKAEVPRENWAAFVNSAARERIDGMKRTQEAAGYVE